VCTDPSVFSGPLSAERDRATPLDASARTRARLKLKQYLALRDVERWAMRHPVPLAA
jgi:hypothetical protein